jgi:hypothetical protein
MMVSSCCGCRCTACTKDQSSTKASRRSLVSRPLKLRSRIQVLLLRASWTDLFFFREAWKRVGAMSFGRRPWIQPESQKLVFLPSPSTTVVQAANKSLSSSSHGVSVPAQGLSGETHWCQSHLSLSALANFSKLGKPGPPLSFGKQVRVPFTLH